MSLEGKGLKKSIRHDDIGKLTKPTFKLKMEPGGITSWLLEMDKYMHRNQEDSHDVLYAPYQDIVQRRVAERHHYSEAELLTHECISAFGIPADG